MFISSNVDRSHRPETKKLWVRVLWVVGNFLFIVVAFVIFYLTALSIVSPKDCEFNISKAGFESNKLADNNKVQLDFWMDGILRTPKQKTFVEVQGIRMEVHSPNSWSRQLIPSSPGLTFILTRQAILF